MLDDLSPQEQTFNRQTQTHNFLPDSSYLKSMVLWNRAKVFHLDENDDYDGDYLFVRLISEIALDMHF